MLRRDFIKLPIIAGLSALMPALSYAKGISLRSDMVQGFNFQKDVRTPVGHITSLKISGKAFENTLKVQDPTDIESGPAKEVTGVISAIRWNGGVSEPIIFTCQVTNKNREIAAILTHTNLTNIDVEFAFDVYEFDAKAEKPGYYLSFHTGNKSINGTIEKNGGNLEFEIDHDPTPDIPSPRNYELYISVMPPANKIETIHLATSKSNAFTKPWGTDAN